MSLFHPGRHPLSCHASRGRHKTPTTVLRSFACRQNLLLSPRGLIQTSQCLQSASPTLANTGRLWQPCPNSFTTGERRRGGSELHPRTVLAHSAATAPPEVAAMTLPLLFSPRLDLLPSPMPTIVWGSLGSAAKEGFPILKKGGKSSGILSCPCERTAATVQLQANATFLQFF